MACCMVQIAVESNLPSALLPIWPSHAVRALAAPPPLCEAPAAFERVKSFLASPFRLLLCGCLAKSPISEPSAGTLKYALRPGRRGPAFACIDPSKLMCQCERGTLPQH